MHGGRVEAHSEAWARQRVHRPPARRCPTTSPQRRRRKPAERAASLRHRASTRVLVVDDNRDAADSLGMLLNSGHEVRVAHDGPPRLEAVGMYRPDVVFLDIGMPGMDGYEVARRLRQQPSCADVLLVAH